MRTAVTVTESNYTSSKYFVSQLLRASRESLKLTTTQLTKKSFQSFFWQKFSLSSDCALSL